MGLVSVLVVSYLALMFWVWFLVPTLGSAFGDLAAPPPAIDTAAIGFCRFLARTWLLWPALAAAAWAVFEWRCRSESKAAIRMAATAGASLVVVAFACAFATAAMAMSADLLRQVAAG